MSDAQEPTLEEVRAALSSAYDTVMSMFGRLPLSLSHDAVFAIGKAGGMLSRARSHVQFDIDTQKRN